MNRLPIIALLLLSGNAFADPGHARATVDKTGTFRGVGSIRDPRPEPGSNGDIQNIRWDAHEGFERIVLDLHENEYEVKKTPPLKTPGYYKISNETYPCRLVCDLNGRQINGLDPAPDLSKSKFVTGIHRITVLDDSSVKFALELREPVEIEVFELHDPARIVIDIRSASLSAKRFSVRTPGMAGGETLGHLDELLFSKGFKGLRTLRCADGSYCIEAGLFSHRDEAAALAGKIAAEGISVFVEERGISDSPKGS